MAFRHDLRSLPIVVVVLAKILIVWRGRKASTPNQLEDLPETRLDSRESAIDGQILTTHARFYIPALGPHSAPKMASENLVEDACSEGINPYSPSSGTGGSVSRVLLGVNCKQPSLRMQEVWNLQTT